VRKLDEPKIATLNGRYECATLKNEGPTSTRGDPKRKRDRARARSQGAATQTDKKRKRQRQKKEK